MASQTANWKHVNGTVGAIKTIVSSANTSNPPTQAQLVSAFGAAANAQPGYIGILNDNGGGTAVYLVMSDGANWFYILATVGA